MFKRERTAFPNDIAIIGINGLFPKSQNLEEFWQHLLEGRELSSVTDTSSYSPRSTESDNFVPKVFNLDGKYEFDAEFFRVNPQLAKMMDPQNRKILESVWLAVDNSGYSPKELIDKHTVGVFAGKDFSEYWIEHVLPYIEQTGIDTAGNIQAFIGNGQDFTANWIAYKLNSNGPAINIQTACSTGLSALCIAYQNLLLDYCDVAIVSAARIELDKGGYFFEPNLMFSKEGKCRPLDALADGIVAGSAVVTVILKKLSKALEDKDSIWGVIKGVGISNDGAMKQDFMAPGIQGQSKAIRDALKRANVEPQEVDYIELHGTGTKLGDPIEIAALKTCYHITRQDPCYLGSVKANIGHSSTCAGLASLVKVLLAFKYQMMPPMANFHSLNPLIKLDDTSFAVNTEPKVWQSKPHSLRKAGISSFGFGGTNVHIIVEEPLKEWRYNPSSSPISCKDVTLVFTGQGGNITTQMGRQLYADSLVFRQAVDECKRIFTQHFGNDIANKIWPFQTDQDWNLKKPSILQPAIITYQYALFKVWQEKGISIKSIIGHSLGELMAFYVAGSISLEVALVMAYLRGKSFEIMPSFEGAMLITFADVDSLPPLQGTLSLSVFNDEKVTVISGLKEDIANYRSKCEALSIHCATLPTTHPFHSPLLFDVAAEFRKNINETRLYLSEQPRIDIYSTLTGEKYNQAPDLDYWVSHLYSPTLFYQARNSLLNQGSGDDSYFIEIGPLTVLSNYLKVKNLKTIAAPVSAESEGQYFETLSNMLHDQCLEKSLISSAHFNRKKSFWIPRAQNTSSDSSVANIQEENSTEETEELTLNVLQNKLIKYWEQVLGVENIRLTDSFFELGGTSLSAIQIQAKIKQELDVSLSMLDFMSSKNIETLSKKIVEKIKSR